MLPRRFARLLLFLRRLLTPFPTAAVMAFTPNPVATGIAFLIIFGPIFVNNERNEPPQLCGTSPMSTSVSSSLSSSSSYHRTSGQLSDPVENEGQI